MKTRILFSMMCTAALFAACSSEEFEQEVGTSLNRKTLNVSLTADNVVAGNADTRLGAAISNGSMTYAWTETDKLGAAMLDGGSITPGTYEASDKVAVNYEFGFTTGGEEASNFTAKAPIMEGAYMFYYQYKPNTTRSTLTLAVEPQQEYVATEGTPENQMAKYYVGVSPVLNLSQGIAMGEEATNLNIPLKFKKLNATIKLALTPKDLPEGTEITKIELKEWTGATIRMGGEYQFPTGTVLTSGGTQNAIEVVGNAALAEDITAGRDNINAYNILGGTAVNSSSIAVSMYANADNQAAGKRGVALNNNETFDAYMVVPVTNGSTKYKVAIYTSEGKIEFTTGNMSFASGTVYASAFAFELKKADMESYTAFNVSSTADWDEAVSYVAAHATDYMGQPVNFNIFQGEIYVNTLPSFPITLTSQNAASKIILGKKNKATTTINVEKQITMGTATAFTIEVGEGAEVNYKTDVNGAAVSLVNNGTLNVQVATAKTITNNAILNVKAAQAGANLTNAKGATLTFEGGADTKVAYTTSLQNNGNVVVNENAVLKTSAFAAGAIAAGDPTPVVTVNGEWDHATAATDVTTVAGTKVVIASTGVFDLAANVAGATIEVNGRLNVNDTSCTNAGEITIKAGAKSNGETLTNTGKVIIDNYSDYSANQDSNSSKFDITNGVGGVTTVNVTTAAQYAGVTSDGNINDITLNGGTWTAKDGTSGTIALSTSKGLTLKGATVVLDNTTTTISAVTLNIDGNSSVIGNGKELQVKNVKVNSGATFTLNKGAKITVDADASTSTYEMEVLGTLVNKGTITGGTTNAMQVKVGAPVTGPTNKHAAILKNDDSSAIFGDATKKAAIDNYGTLIFKTGTANITFTNYAGAVFEGNIN